MEAVTEPTIQGAFRATPKAPFLSGGTSKVVWLSLIHCTQPPFKVKLRCCLLQEVFLASPFGPGAYFPLNSPKPMFPMKVSPFYLIFL